MDEHCRIRTKSPTEIADEFMREKRVLYEAYQKQLRDIAHLCGDDYALTEARDRACAKALKEYLTSFYELAASYGLWEAKP